MYNTGIIRSTVHYWMMYFDLNYSDQRYPENVAEYLRHMYYVIREVHKSAVEQ
jgi:hypothetical protein